MVLVEFRGLDHDIRVKDRAVFDYITGLWFVNGCIFGIKKGPESVELHGTFWQTFGRC